MSETPDSGSGPRRRGRRPKGGKLIAAPAPPEAVEVPAPNIILHLKCRVQDLKDDAYMVTAPGVVKPENDRGLSYQSIAAATVNQANFMLGERRAQGICRFRIEGIMTRPGAAIDTYFLDFSIHEPIWHRAYGIVKPGF